MNIGVIAHVDAGKTTVTEQMLAACGVIANAGRVDHGSTVTDTLPLERKRGISIKATPVSFVYGDYKINLIDTPGHVDFIAEVERSLGILDGVVLVVSAREGVQTQTRLFIKVVRDLKLPCVIFINKADRTGAEVTRVQAALHKAFAQRTVLLQTILHEGTRNVTCEARAFPDIYADAAEMMCDLEDAFMQMYVENRPVTEDYFFHSFTTLAHRAEIYPVLAGSALRGVGIAALLEAATQYLPTAGGETEAPLSAVVFKVDARSIERTAYLRLYGGTLRVRDTFTHLEKTEKIARLKILENGRIVNGHEAEAGDVCLLNIKNLRVGDVIGVPPDARRGVMLARPALSVRIEPANPAERRRLYEALLLMAEEDPLISLDVGEGETRVSLFGEVQMDILRETLQGDYGLETRFVNPRPLYKETPAAPGEAAIPMGHSHFAAGVGFAVTPLPRDTGLQYRSDVWLGSLEKTFQRAVEEAVFTTCKSGVYGLPVTDALVVFNFSQYNSVESTPSDYRHLTPQVLMNAFKNAGMQLLEPLMAFELTAPETAAGKALFDCRRMEAEIHETVASHGEITITGLVPFENARNFPLELAAYTEGQGIFITRLHGYRETAFDEQKINRKA